jgi:hypothetical protein
MAPDLTSIRVGQRLPECSAEIVLSTLLFEEVELLKGLQSVDGKDKSIVGGHTETGHEVLNLDVIEDHGGDVMGVLLGHGLVGVGLNLGGDSVSVSEEGGSDLVAEGSGVVISLLLGVGDSEREILGDLVEVTLDGGKELSLWVLLNLSGFSSSSLVSSNVLIGNGISSHIWESRDVLNGVWVVMVVSLNSSSSGDKSAICQEFHYFI